MTAKLESNERKWVLLLCLLAAIHVFIFSAAFPFFNNVDEQLHLDLAIKYSQVEIPRRLEFLSTDSLRYIAIYSSLQFLGNPNDFTDGRFPPPLWTQSLEKAAPIVLARENAWKNINTESSQPPLYYTAAASWWRLGQAFGLEGESLLYWIRFLNVFFVVALVWLAHAATRIIFPENLFARFGVPALIAFIPQTAFYSINNDILSSVCFGAAFILLIKFWRAEIPGVRLGIETGLALAATFLAKISNLPLLAVAGIFIARKIKRLLKENKLRPAFPAILSLAFCAGLPMILWLARTKHYFGDFTGSAAKIQFLGWTHKPFAEWLHHPIFTPHGFWIFIHDLLSTFWQGEFLWHRKPLDLPAVDLMYVVLTFILTGVALMHLLPKSKSAAPQREALWFGAVCFIATIIFSGFLSIIYDFHDCFYPSTAHPYFTSGRLMLGALIPFMLLFVFGLDCALKKFGNVVKFSTLGIFILFMLVSEIVTDWPVFFSQYNWFHL